MASYTLTADTNIDALTSKAGTDTYVTDGWTLTIDQDSRTGLNQTTSASLGQITISSLTGGKVLIDARKVRLIPYDTGTGNVPAWNTAITKGSASGLLIGVYSSLTVASTATGAAMPASGYLKIKQWNDVAYSSGALGGISANATGADTVGWLEIVATQAVGGSTMYCNRLGSFEAYGEWLNIGSTSGSSNQTLQIPNNGLLRYAAGVYIEKTAGQADYEFYPNAGTTTTTGTEATRGKVVWIDNTGLVRIGNSGAGTNGYTPASGLAVVVPNIFLENCTSGSETANVIPNATLGSRYELETLLGGVVIMDKVNCAWYLNFTQAYSVALTNMCTIDALNLEECATAVTWSKVGVGNKPTTALATSPLVMKNCFAGGTLTDCVWARVTMASAGVVASLTDIDGFTFTNNVFRGNTIRSAANAYAVSGSRVKNSTFTTPVLIGNGIYLTGSPTVTITDAVYADNVSGTTGSGNATSAFIVEGASSDITISGLTFPVTNTHPYTSLLAINASGVQRVKLRSIGTYASPLSLGSANATGYIYNFAASSAAYDVKVQRVYCSNIRTAIMTADNTAKLIVEENVYGDYADATTLITALNFKVKGRGETGAYTAQQGVYGSHWFDKHLSSTTGRIGIMMNESNALTSAYVTLSGGAGFTGGGAFSATTSGDYAIWEMEDYMIGHSELTSGGFIDAPGADSTAYTYDYAIDLNDGNGFNTLSTSNYNRSAIITQIRTHTINPLLGFKLKLKIRAAADNAEVPTSFYFGTVSSTTTQAYQYPLDVVTLSVTAKDATSFAAIQDARVFLEADTGGYLPAGASITITRSGSTATVAHTAHGLATGASVIVRGANQDEYNGVKSITVTGVDAYTYTVSGTPASPATGTITATSLILTGTTNASGILTGTMELESSQPVIGKVRRASTGTKYKTGTVLGTITTAGFTNITLLISDE